MTTDEERRGSLPSHRAARVRDMAERIFVAAAPTLFTQVGSDREAAGYAFDVAEAFEQEAEARNL